MQWVNPDLSRQQPDIGGRSPITGAFGGADREDPQRAVVGEICRVDGVCADDRHLPISLRGTPRLPGVFLNDPPPDVVRCVQRHPLRIVPELIGQEVVGHRWDRGRAPGQGC